MKKLLILAIILIVMGCSNAPVIETDPSIKESERIAVMEKMKTDTTITAFIMDEHWYFVQKDKIIGKCPVEQHRSSVSFLAGVCAISLLWIILIGLSRDV